MSRFTLKYFESVIAAAKLWAVANSFGSVVLEWPCIATTIWCRSANGTTRRATGIVVDAVMYSAPSALVISKPRSISASVMSAAKL